MEILPSEEGGGEGETDCLDAGRRVAGRGGWGETEAAGLAVRGELETRAVGEVEADAFRELADERTIEAVGDADGGADEALASRSSTSRGASPM